MELKQFCFSSLVRWAPKLPSHSHDVIPVLIIACVDFNSDDVHTVRYLLSFPETADKITFIVRPIFVYHSFACVRLHSEPNDANILNNCHAYLFDCDKLAQVNRIFIPIALCASVLEPRGLDAIGES